MGGRRKPKDKRLSEAELIAITGISRELTRRRQQGLILAILSRVTGSAAVAAQRRSNIH
jgi:hypothetical protein